MTAAESISAIESLRSRLAEQLRCREPSFGSHTDLEKWIAAIDRAIDALVFSPPWDDEVRE